MSWDPFEALAYLIAVLSGVGMMLLPPELAVVILCVSATGLFLMAVGALVVAEWEVWRR